LEVCPSTDNNHPEFVSGYGPSVSAELPCSKPPKHGRKRFTSSSTDSQQETEEKRLRDLCQNLKQLSDQTKGPQGQADNYYREINLEMKEKCARLESDVTDREGKIESLRKNLAHQEAEKKKFRSMCLEWQVHSKNVQKEHDSENSSLNKKLNDLKSNVNMLTHENARLKKTLQELQADHIRSVNSIGTGLESIADKTFEDTFRGLQKQVYVPTFSV
jgi:chromosome segregation ATPase